MEAHLMTIALHYVFKPLDQYDEWPWNAAKSIKPFYEVAIFGTGDAIPFYHRPENGGQFTTEMYERGPKS
jgi:hypothetical protein